MTIKWNEDNWSLIIAKEHLELSADLPDPLPLMTKISEADPPSLDPSGGLLHVGKAGQEVQLLLRLGLG